MFAGTPSSRGEDAKSTNH